MKYLVFLFLIACSSKPKNMRGFEAEQMGGEKRDSITITAEPDKSLSIETYRFLNVYFYNSADEWCRLKNVSIKDLKGISEFHVIRGEDLESWRKSMLLNDELVKEEAKKNKKPQLSDGVRKKLKDLDLNTYAEGSYALPSKLQTQRWLLLQLPKNESQGTMILEVEFADSEKAQYEVKFPGDKK